MTTAADGGASARGLGEKDIRDIKAAIEIWAASVAAGDYAKWLSYFAEDAVLMPPGHESVEGRAAIDAFVRGEIGPLSAFTFTDWRFAGSGNLAVVTSNWTAGDLDCKHQVVLRRQAAGGWLIETVIYNANNGS